MTLLKTMWQLPQSLLALAIRVYCMFFSGAINTEKQMYNGATVYWVDGVKRMSGVSLGEFIFINTDWRGDLYILDHEYGHTRQSLRWGWLYLLVVGLPSVLRVLVVIIKYKQHSTTEKLKELKSWYYSGWPEKQADILGGVNRVKG